MISNEVIAMLSLKTATLQLGESKKLGASIYQWPGFEGSAIYVMDCDYNGNLLTDEVALYNATDLKMLRVSMQVVEDPANIEDLRKRITGMWVLDYSDFFG